MSLDPSKEGWERLDELFHQALELPPDEVASFCDTACGDDKELREFLYELVTSADVADERIRASISLMAHDVARESLSAGQRVGAYRIDELIGRGGMGEVYLASRADGQFEKQVAIKVVRRRLNHDTFAHHFKTERQALANLRHPYIPTLLDAGQLDDGRPYLVAEYVRGVPIDEYCRDNDLPVPERVALLAKLGEAVQHAHSRQVLHLDIKPSNVLIEQDGAPQLLDFGVSRLVEDSDIAQQAFTPAYASPEQLRGEQPTAACDVYSLGVLMYTVLAGQSPFAAPRYSPTQTRIAERQELEERMEHAKPVPGLDPDLQAILHKTIALAVKDRYPTVESLLQDLKSQRRPMCDDLPSGTLTLLLTDIEGSTRLLQRLGAAGYAKAQRDHHALLRAAFRSHGGVEVHTQGDAFFYVFPEAPACLRAAVAGTRALAGHEWDHGDPVEVRMGMHTGQAELTEEGYVGIAVNQAARIASAGHGGQVLISQNTAQLLAGELDNDITLRDLGEHRLKDFDDAQRLFQAVIPELPSDFSPPRTASRRPGNLPTALTPFVGRAQLAARIRDVLLRDDVRAVTLVGTGGTGKTRLGLRIATELLHTWHDGAFFVALAPVRDPGLVPATIAAALQVPEEPGQTLKQTLMAHLQDKDLLLLLDNFEQVRDAAVFVAELLRHCPRIKVLTTTREALRLSGERVVPVPPLELPAPDTALSLQEAAGFEAVRLFVDRAQAAQWDFELTQDNLADVVGICRRVDALPLGIELAAARLYQMNVRQLHEALDRRMSVLTDGAVDLLDHQRTLRDLIAWSYELLEPELQTLWRRLSVFAGGCSLRAARSVCDLEDRGLTADELAALVRKSMLIPGLASGSGAENVVRGAAGHRFTMLSTLREFAQEALEETDEAALVKRRFHEWCVRLAEEARPHLRGADSPRWFAVLDPEATNFRATMDQCTNDASADPEIALRLGTALWFFWYSRGQMTEGRQQLQKALTAGESADAAIRAEALLSVATIARQQNLLEDAQAAGEQALQLFRERHDEPNIAAALSELGAIAEREEDHARAVELLTEAMQLLRRQQNRERLAVTLNLLGIVEQLRDNPQAALPHYEESLAIGRELGDQNIVGTALVNLGEIAQARGKTHEAAERFRESLQVWAQLDQGLAIAYCLEVLAGLAASANGGEQAAILFGAADYLREKQEIPVEAYNLERYRRDIDRAKQALGEPAFNAAWKRGRKLPLQNVIALALTGHAGVGPV